MNTKNEADRGAVAGQVERSVRPRVWMVRRHDAPNYWIPFLHEPVDALKDPEREVVRLHWPEEFSAERERCAKPVPDEWLVKVRRLVQGFEHVSGIARLWEPDYSSGSERALWSRATEACADVAKLLRDAEGPNAKLSGLGREED